MNNPWSGIDPPASNVNVRRIDHKHPLELFWARDRLGNYLFIYDKLSLTDGGFARKVELVGIKVAFMPPEDGAAPGRLVLVLKERENWELFLSLCWDLVQATSKCSGESSAVSIIIRRLNRWQEFLKRARTNMLSEESIKGLIGELLFIRNYLKDEFGLPQAIRFWQGPEGFPQDFCVNNSAIEVKCQLGTTTPTIKISSAEQLKAQLPKLYLFVVTLGKTSADDKEAINLPKLIAEIRDSLEDTFSEELEHFNDLLLSIGYWESDKYLDYSYLLACDEMFEVLDGFPRIVPEELHCDIVKLSYSISLAGCEEFKGKPNWMGI